MSVVSFNDVVYQHFFCNKVFDDILQQRSNAQFREHKDFPIKDKNYTHHKLLAAQHLFLELPNYLQNACSFSTMIYNSKADLQDNISRISFILIIRLLQLSTYDICSQKRRRHNIFLMQVRYLIFYLLQKLNYFIINARRTAEQNLSFSIRL